MSAYKLPDDWAPLAALGFEVYHRDGNVWTLFHDDVQNASILVEFRPELEWESPVLDDAYTPEEARIELIELLRVSDEKDRAQARADAEWAAAERDEPFRESGLPQGFESWADYNAALGAEIALDPRNR